MEFGWYVSFRDAEAYEGLTMGRSQLYDYVALTRDIEELGLKRGDLASLVETVPHPSGGPAGMVLEISNALGESLRVVTVTAADIEPLRADEILSVRPLAPAV